MLWCSESQSALGLQQAAHRLRLIDAKRCKILLIRGKNAFQVAPIIRVGSVLLDTLVEIRLPTEHLLLHLGGKCGKLFANVRAPG